MVEGRHATGELAYHIPKCNSSIAHDLDGRSGADGADDGDGEDMEGFKHGGLSPSLDEPEETYEWPPFVSSNSMIYAILRSNWIVVGH